MLKKKVFAITCIILSHTVQAQVLHYSYDASGNRIGRNDESQTCKKRDHSKNETNDGDMKLYTFDNYKIWLGPSPTSGLLKCKVENFNGRYIHIVAVNADNGKIKDFHFTTGYFTFDITSLPNGIIAINFVLAPIVGTTITETVKIIKK